MEDLKTLINLISKNKTKNIEIIGNESESNSNYQKLYEGIVNGEFKDDLDASTFFFSNSNNRAYYFSRLKKQLHDRLINTLFFIDINQPNFSEYQRAYYTCYKAATVTKILISRHARSVAIKIAEKTIKYAAKFEFTDIILLLAKDLRFHYGGIVGHKKKYKYYNEVIAQYSSLFNAELLAEEYYTQIIINFTNSTATKPEMVKLSEEYTKELDLIRSEHNSYWFNLIYFNIKTVQYELANNYKKTIEVAREALSFFEQKEHLATMNARSIFLFKIIGAQIYLKHFEEIEEYINKCLELTQEGSFNWFLTYDRFMIYLFHSQQFNRAHEVFVEISNHPQFKAQLNRVSENWTIHEAFLQYFIVMGKITIEKEVARGKFRISKFLNQFPTFSKDKRGSNITILLLQILFLLQQKKYGDIIDRMEALKSYSHRYLRKDGTFRSNCFIKMLLCLPAASFHKKAVLRKADKYWKKLQEVPIEEANQSVELEIVPYEMLWEFVLEELDEKWH